MEESPLIKLPLEIQRIIIINLLWTDQPAQHVPMSFTMLHVCRYLRQITLDILRRDFKWLEWRIYRCVGSSFMMRSPLKTFERCLKMLASCLTEEHYYPVVTFEICACGPRHKYHSEEFLTCIIAPFETLTLATTCALMTKDLITQEALAQLTINTDDRTLQMGQMLEVFKLKLRHVMLQSSDEMTPIMRRLQNTVCLDSVDGQLIMEFFSRRLAKTRRALNDKHPYKALTMFSSATDMFQHAEMLEICLEPLEVNNTTGFLYSCLGLATLQAICQMLLAHVNCPPKMLNTIRAAARAAATFHISLEPQERWNAYIWDVACLALLIARVGRSSPLYLKLLLEAQKSYHYATEIQREIKFPDEIRARFSLDAKTAMIMLAPVITRRTSNWKWTGPPKEFENWEKAPSWAVSRWKVWKVRTQDVVNQIEVHTPDDPVEIILKAIS